MHNRLKSIRKTLRYTQEEIGEICGIKKNVYSMIETGNSKLSNHNFETLTSKFNINKEWLINGVGNMFYFGELVHPSSQIKCSHSYMPVPVYDINTINSNGNNSPSSIVRYLPFCNATPDDIAVITTDLSMSPVLAINSVLLLRRCKKFDPIYNSNKPHLIIFKDGSRYVRNLSEHSEYPNLIILHAENMDYDDVEIEENRITAIYKVLASYYDNLY